jgi:arabinogalactan oligomer/maltooligosaccharide transport system substrate-binding protein
MKRHLRIAGLVAGVAIVAAACSTSTASNAPSAAPSTAASAAPSDAGPSLPAQLSGDLTIWHAYGSSGGNAEFKAFSRIIEGIELLNPDLNLTVLEVPFADIYKKFETESAAGGGPDLFIGPNDSVGSEARGGFLVDANGKIDSVIDNSNEISVNGSKVTVNGTEGVYMVPESLKAVAMYYDTELVPTAPASTDDLMTFVKGGGKVGIISGAYFGWGFYGAFGGEIFDANGKCAATANTGVADALQYVLDLKTAGALVDADYGKVNDAFLNKEIDVMMNGNWTLGDYKAARPALGVAPVPAGPGGAAATMTGVDGWYINAASKNQDLAISVAEELVSQASQTIYVDVAGHVPANKNITIIDPLVKAFSEAINTGDPRPQIEQMNNYWGNFDKAWADVLTAGVDPTTAVATACSAMDAANGF